MILQTGFDRLSLSGVLEVHRSTQTLRLSLSKAGCETRGAR